MSAHNWTKKLLGIGMALSIALSMSACGSSDTPTTTESTGQTTETTAPISGTDKKAPGSKDSKNNGKTPTDKTVDKKPGKTGSNDNGKTDKKTSSKDNQPKENAAQKETQPKDPKPSASGSKNEAPKEQNPAPTNPKATDPAPAPTEPKETKPAHTHNYIAVVTPPSCITEGYTKYTCACGDGWVGDHTEMLGHNYSDWSTTKEPTTEAEGQQTRTCSRCGETETRSIDKLPAPEPAITEADIPSLESYARSYAESVGFIVDTSLNLGNAGYYPAWGMKHNSVDAAKAYIREGVDFLVNDFSAEGGVQGTRYNCIIQINSDGELVDYHLYG